MRNVLFMGFGAAQLIIFLAGCATHDPLYGGKAITSGCYTIHENGRSETRCTP